MTTKTLTICIFLAAAPIASAQSLFVSNGEGSHLDGAPLDPAEPLYALSLIAVQPPEPKSYSENDLITIVVRENSTMKHDQKLETESDFKLDAMRIEPLEFLKFLTLSGGPGSVANLADFSIDNKTSYDGEGKYQRKDVFTTRVTARVLEVKPNGTLLIEAKTIITTDDEVQEFRLSGLCRTEDVTDNNTVESSQIFDLRLEAHHEGEVKDANKKGLIVDILESIFAF